MVLIWFLHAHESCSIERLVSRCKSDVSMDAPNLVPFLAPVQSGKKILLSSGVFASYRSGPDFVGKQRLGSEDLNSKKMQYRMNYSNLQGLVLIYILEMRAFCQAWIYREG